MGEGICSHREELCSLREKPRSSPRERTRRQVHGEGPGEEGPRVGWMAAEIMAKCPHSSFASWLGLSGALQGTGQGRAT